MLDKLNQKNSSYTAAPKYLFDIGTKVKVVKSSAPGHRRTPGYIRGRVGTIERICGAFPNPEELAYGFDGLPERVLYRVAFKQIDVWPEYIGSPEDLIEMVIFEHWLRKQD